MKDSLKRRCELLVLNRDIIKAEFKWESSYMYPLSASLFAVNGETANADVMQRCKDLLKQKTSIFSNFRGTSKIATISMLAMSYNSDEKMDQIIGIYNDLKNLFFGSEYLTVTAAAISNLAETSQYQQIIKRTRVIYDLMKSSHPILTSGEDSPFAALLAVSDFDDSYIAEESERCFSMLKPEFFSGNAVQSLSNVLTLGQQNTSEKCDRVLELYKYLRSNGYKYGKEYELATLGVLALLDVPVEVLAQDIMQADDFLKEQKGFGSFTIGSKQRLMYAGMMTMAEYISDASKMQVTAMSGVVSLVIAQQAAICACIAASAAASSAAAAGSSS